MINIATPTKHLKTIYLSRVIFTPFCFTDVFGKAAKNSSASTTTGPSTIHGPLPFTLPSISPVSELYENSRYLYLYYQEYSSYVLFVEDYNNLHKRYLSKAYSSITSSYFLVTLEHSLLWAHTGCVFTFCFVFNL